MNIVLEENCIHTMAGKGLSPEEMVAALQELSENESGDSEKDSESNIDSGDESFDLNSQSSSSSSDTHDSTVINVGSDETRNQTDTGKEAIFNLNFITIHSGFSCI